MSSERTGRCRSSGGGGGPHGKTAFGNVPFRAGWLLSVSLLASRVVRDKRFRADAGTNVPGTGGPVRVPERCRSMPPHLFGVGARMRGREVGREPALSGPVRAGPGKGPAACAADLLSAVAGKRPAVVRPLRPSTGNPFCGINGRSYRPSRGVPVAERLYFAPFPVSRFASLGRMPVQGGRKRPKGDLLLQVALRFIGPAVARRRFPDRENLPALSSARSVRDRRGIN